MESNRSINQIKLHSQSWENLVGREICVQGQITSNIWLNSRWGFRSWHFLRHVLLVLGWIRVGKLCLFTLLFYRQIVSYLWHELHNECDFLQYFILFFYSLRKLDTSLSPHSFHSLHSFLSLTQVLRSVDLAKLVNMKGLTKFSSRFATNQTLSQRIKILSVTVFDFWRILPLKYWSCVNVLFPLKEEEEKHSFLFLSSAELTLLLEWIQIIQLQIDWKKLRNNKTNTWDIKQIFGFQKLC